MTMQSATTVAYTTSHVCEKVSNMTTEYHIITRL